MARQRHAETLQALFENACLELSCQNGLNDKSSIRQDALLLLLHCAKISKEQFYAHPEAKASAPAAKRLLSLIKERKMGYSVAALTGHKEFYALDFLVSKSVLIPRCDSEAMVEEALKMLKGFKGHAHILDVCCGTGCIGISIAHSLQTLKTGFSLTLSDISRRAIKIAKANCQRLDIPAKTVCGDLFSGMDGQKFDLVTANPPYVSEKTWQTLAEEVKKEPRRSLIAKEEGLRTIKEIVKNAPSFMSNGATLIVETDPEQTEMAKKEALLSGFGKTWEFKDLAGRLRGIVAQKTKIA